MKKRKNLLFILMLTIFSTNIVKAECTTEEENNMKKEIDKIEIIYKHLGEVTKDDGTKTYNEFMVTAKNIPDGVYVHLYPFTDEQFEESPEGLKLKLTTGTWHYYMYSEKCGKTLKDITVTLPKFNEYSLDPLCEGVDGEDFRYCNKYYDGEIPRETFERKVKEYRLANHLDDKKVDSNDVKKKDYLKPIVDFLLEYYLYIIIGIGVIVLISLLVLIIKKKKKRTILE